MKIYLSLLLFTLAGCQATNPQIHQDNKVISKANTVTQNLNSQNNIDNGSVDKKSNKVVESYLNKKYTTLIDEPSYIEDDKNKPGEYPLQYQYIIANSIQAQPTILFKPIPYVTSKKNNAWGTCYINYAENNNIYFLSIIKNNEIIETFTSPDIAKICDDLKNQQTPIEEAKENALHDITVKKFASLVDDPDKFHLFGEAPLNPINIIKNQLNFFLEDPPSAEIKNVSVRKTFLISQDKVIYCYLVFVNLRTKDVLTGMYREEKKAIFYMKDDKILEHKIFSNFNSGLKPKKQFNPPELIEDTVEQSIVRKTYTIPQITKNIKPIVVSPKKYKSKTVQIKKKTVKKK